MHYTGTSKNKFPWNHQCDTLLIGTQSHSLLSKESMRSSSFVMTQCRWTRQLLPNKSFRCEFEGKKKKKKSNHLVRVCPPHA